MIKKKISKLLSLIIFVLTFLSCLFSIDITHVNASTNTASEYVNTVSDLKTTSLIGGATLYEQKMSSLLNGDSKKIFQEHFVQWVDLDNYEDAGMKLVTWTKQSADSWSAATTKACALDWEKNHPGWIVVAGINGDFFQNSGKITWEPTNNFMADGDMYRGDLVGGYRGVVGIQADNSIIVGNPSFSDKMQLYIYDENGQIVEKLNIDGYNTSAPSQTGITLYTKDSTNAVDLTGYQVYVGKYTICRVSNGKTKSVFVKGSIEYARDGESSELPKQKETITNEDGTTTVIDVREFYLVSKNESLASKLQNGTSVKCQLDYAGDWENVENSVGYIYQMLDNGTSLHQESTDSFIYTDHPRTFIGFKADGTPVLMVVDGRGATPAEKNYGISLFEGAEIMKLAGCVNAYNLDGGGSSTLIVRNENGSFDVINRPSDGSERSTGNAVFLVMRDPAIEYKFGKSTSSSVTFTIKNSEYISDVTNCSIHINGKEYPFTEDEVSIGGLYENTSYQAKMSYDMEGKHYSIPIMVKTKTYDPGIDINPTSKGFKIGLRQTDENLITSKITMKIEEETYIIENEEGQIKEYNISDYYKGETYRISYTYEVTIKETKETYTREVGEKEYSTLSYEIPEITTFTVEQKRGKINIGYDYEDKDELITEIYIQDGTTKIEIEKGSYSYSIEDDKKEHHIQLILVYETPEGMMRMVKSNIVEIEHTHEWKEADCTTPKTCTICGQTEGEALGHEISEWKIETEASCTREGKRYKECTRCGEKIEEETIAKKEHEWEEATTERPKTCRNCGETQGEKLAEEKKKGCKKSAISIILSSIVVVCTSIYIIRKKR